MLIPDRPKYVTISVIPKWSHIEGRIEDTPIFRATNPAAPSTTHVEANPPEPEPWLIAMTPEPSPDLANTAENLFDYSHSIEDTRDLIESDKE